MTYEINGCPECEKAEERDGISIICAVCRREDMEDDFDFYDPVEEFQYQSPRMMFG